ncbi:hypothetical protein [Streptomyces sp. Mo3]
MDLEDLGCRAQFTIRDRDGKFPTLFNAVHNMQPDLHGRGFRQGQ